MSLKVSLLALTARLSDTNFAIPASWFKKARSRPKRIAFRVFFLFCGCFLLKLYYLYSLRCSIGINDHLVESQPYRVLVSTELFEAMKSTSVAFIPNQHKIEVVHHVSKATCCCNQAELLENLSSHSF